MKKISVILLLLLAVVTSQAQHVINPFFDERGGVRPETQELNDAADTLATIPHRADDVVWSRIVYRVIDMRYKQNFQLYFPTNSEDRDYRSLFKVMVDAIIDGLPVYNKQPYDIKPDFGAPLRKADIPAKLMTGNPLDEYMDWDISKSSDFLINYDSINDVLSFNGYSYDSYVKNQIKFMIQEVVFFDKHYSRLYTKIIAIAPMQSDQVTFNENGEPQKKFMDYMINSIPFWVSYDQLRPYLAKQYVIPQSNDVARVTFEMFFANKMYTSYLIGDSNMYSRMFLSYAFTEKAVKQEQQRIFDELLNFEQDLWEY